MVTQSIIAVFVRWEHRVKFKAIFPLHNKSETNLDYMKVCLMWDFPLYAVNMFDYHWLVKMWLCPMAGQSIGRQEN